MTFLSLDFAQKLCPRDLNLCAATLIATSRRDSFGKDKEEERGTQMHPESCTQRSPPFPAFSLVSQPPPDRDTITISFLRLGKLRLREDHLASQEQARPEWGEA